MILEENENPILWKKNLYNALKDLSDIEVQKLTWLGKHPEYISSFTETLAALYDSFDFDRYIRYYESINGRNKIHQYFSELNEMITNYKDFGYETEMKVDGSQIILKDSKWIEITKKAKDIVEALK